MASEAVKVIVRCRPMNEREKALSCQAVISMDSPRGQCFIQNPGATDEPPKQFTFDGAYYESHNTEQIYNEIAYPLVEGVTEGYNGTIFAYGQTGSGKSFTMQGIVDPPTQKGIIPRAFEHVFESVQCAENTKFLVRVSYLEIYNEDIRDLLGADTKQKLELKEHPEKGVYVKGLSLHTVHSVAQCERIMETGWRNRAVGYTLMNKDSSRSHSIFTINMEIYAVDERGQDHLRAAKLNLVDLAGSERQSKTGATGERLKEATKINLSLSALGNVISALVDGRCKHIPYRDSKLTRLLQDSLGGNTKTLMVACLSPADNNYDESLSTLRYANRAKNIKNKPRINEDPKDALLREYQEEIRKLKAILAEQMNTNNLSVRAQRPERTDAPVQAPDWPSLPRARYPDADGPSLPRARYPDADGPSLPRARYPEVDWPSLPRARYPEELPERSRDPSPEEQPDLDRFQLTEEPMIWDPAAEPSDEQIPVSSIIESHHNQRWKWYDTGFESFDFEGLHGFLRTWNRTGTPGSVQPHVIMPSLPNEGDNQGTSCLTLSSELPYQRTIKRKVRKKKKNGIITANVAGTKYEIVRLVIDELGFVKTRDEDETANLIWSDSAVQQDKIAELRNYQRINHFPGMGEICRKDFLARNMTKMIKSQPQEYSFIPRTWIFPAEYMQFQNYVKELKKKRRQKTFIVKPANGAMGHGISLIRNGEKLQAQDHLIVQEYLDKPFLMEGYKFDLRVYILVTSCDPLKIFLYHDGLVRMGTEKYHPPSDSNLSQLYMHLTNYSVNKHNEHFERDETEDKGSKRSIKWFTEFLQTNHLDVTKFWSDISELVVKTLIVAEPHVLHAYRMCRPGQAPGSDSVCFEVLGFDILLDRKLKPWLLEINRAPSFGTDQKIDYDVKKGVLLNALKLLNIRTSDKRRNLAQQKAEAQKRLYGQGSMKRLSPGSSDWEKQRQTLERRREELKERLVQVRKQISKEEHENRHMGNYRRIYPPDDKLLLEKYESLLAIAFQTFLAGRAASLQRELNNPLKRMKEEDILDLLEQCELDDEKLMGKSTRQRGPKPLSSMPESSQTLKKQRNYSSESSCDSSSNTSEWEEETEKEDHNEKKEMKVSYELEENKYKLLERSSPIRRSVSCPRSISIFAMQSQAAEQRPFSAKPAVQMPRPSSMNRSHSLNRNSSSVRMCNTASLGTVHSSGRTKEQEEALTRETLFIFNDMRIKFPGKTDEEAELIIENIMDNWKYHKTNVASYWLIKLDSVKQRKVLDIVRTSVRAVLQRVWRVSDVECLHLYRIFNRVFNRLLWSHGQGLWNCFCNSGSSWETIFSKRTEVVTPEQLQCCQRIVQLCKHCLLVAYKYSADSRGSLTGISPDWDDTRYLLPGPSQLIMKTSFNFICTSSGMPRSNILFTRRYSHL